MLPAVKVFAVAVLLGGGAVGTFALAGGFGPGGSGSGNGEATAQVAARPAVTTPKATEPVALVPGVTPAAPLLGTDLPAVSEPGSMPAGSEAETLPAAGAAKDDSNTLGSEVQQREDISSDQSSQPVPQVNSQAQIEGDGVQSDARVGSDRQPQQQTSPQPLTVESGSSGERGSNLESGVRSDTLDSASEGQVATVGGKVGTVGNGDTVDNNAATAIKSSVPGESLGADPTVQQEASGDNVRVDGASDPLPSTDSGNTAGKAGSAGTEGEKTRTASGGEEAS